MDDNLKKLHAVHDCCGVKVKKMVKETPGELLDHLVEATSREDVKKPLFSIVMTYITYLFTSEYLMLKRKERK